MSDQNDDDLGGDGSRAGRVRKESEGYNITEEQETTLLAGGEDNAEDLDYIEINVKDFDSDIEEAFRRKDAERVELQEETGTAEEAVSANKVELQEVVRIVHTVEPLEGFVKEAPAPGDDEDDDDRDVIQIAVENDDDLLEEAPSGGEKAKKHPAVSVHISDATEKERILSKPLVKQVVMDVSGKNGENEFNEQRERPLGSPKAGEDDLAETAIETQEDSDAEQPLVIADSVEANVGTMSGHHQEDPDVLQLKLDLHQSMGEMDYEPDDDDHPDPLKDGQADDEGRFQIKQEPMSPVKDRLERILSELEDIPTIVVSSDDDFVEEQKRSKKKKKKTKKKAKQRSQSECSVIDDGSITVEESLPSTSAKSLHSGDLMMIDDESMMKTGFRRMQLRKRKNATHLEETGTPSPSRKRRNPVRQSDDCRSSMGQSKSRTSIISTGSSIISEDVLSDKPVKKTSSKKSIFQPISTVDKLKSNSLFADCEKPEVVPASILDDGIPLLGKDVFEHVFKSLPSRQIMLIDALPNESSVFKTGHKSVNEQPRKSKSAQKPKVVSEVMHSLENDLAMSSSDEEAPLQSMLGSTKCRYPAPKKTGRKRGRAPKQRIEDFLGSSPPDSKKDPQPTEATPKKVKRRKKRSRLCSDSDSEDETTTVAESISLAGTSSTITTARSVTTREEEDDEQHDEPGPPKTEEMRVVLSPLTNERIEKLCNTPKMARTLSKGSQTELEGLSWRIDLNQIDFHSEYFEKLYQLIRKGREQRNQPRRNNNFDGVVMVGRDAVQPPTPPERSPQRPPAAAVNGRARSGIDRLLFDRHLDEVEFVTATRVDPAARERMERSIRANFRIPKIAKQPSRSPQDVTSSTQHDNDDENRRSSSGSGYSNDRHVAPEPRRHITIGSPVRIPTLPEVAAPAAAGTGGVTNRPLAPIRRTIRNENVQQQPVPPPPPPQPVENGFPLMYEQRQPQPPQYQASSGGYMTQQQPQPLQQQLGSYSASGQEMDVKPNISALANPAAMLGGGLMNNRFIDSIHLVCQLTLMQMQQQQLQFPAMNAPGQMFPGPSGVPIAAASNSAPAPPPMPSQMMLAPSAAAGSRIVGIPDGVHDDFDQISQIFGCIDFLKGRCIKNPCHYSHTLPAEADLLKILLGSGQDVVMETYQFIVGLDNLFVRYFPVYADVMGRRNMRHQLLDAVSHCEQSKRAFSHYRFIVDGLTANGTLTRSRAVQLVLERHRKIDFGQINVLIRLILDTGDDVPQFLQWLDQFSQVKDYHFEVPSINLLLAFCVRSSRSTNGRLHGTVADVAKLTYGLVMSVVTGKEPFIDANSLLEYTELLMKSNLGLDHEKIRHKYGKYELEPTAARH